jgi:hypothetical protein
MTKVLCSDTSLMSYKINRLTQKHDGRYLATVTADCLKRFGLDKYVCQTASIFSYILKILIASGNLYGQCQQL